MAHRAFAPDGSGCCPGARFGRVDVWTDHRVHERCHEACQIAKGEECVCSCLGKNYGEGRHLAGWVEVGDSGVLVTDEIIRQQWVVEA